MSKRDHIPSSESIENILINSKQKCLNTSDSEQVTESNQTTDLSSEQKYERVSELKDETSEKTEIIDKNIFYISNIVQPNKVELLEAIIDEIGKRIQFERNRFFMKIVLVDETAKIEVIAFDKQIENLNQLSEIIKYKNFFYKKSLKI